MGKSKASFQARLKYRFDNFMSRGGMSVFLALMCLFLSAIIIVAILRFVANLVLPQENMAGLADQWWLSFLQIADGGSIGEDTGSNAAHRVVGIVALVLGMVLFSSLVAFITAQFEEMLSNLRKGRSSVIEENHTLILGFGDRALEIIRELIVANESEKDAAIVVLAENEKDEMDDFFRERIEDPKTTRIITRSGSTSSMQFLKRVGVTSAKSVIILNQAAQDAPYTEKALADARVLKTILAVISCTGEEQMPPIVAELHLEHKQQLAAKLSSKISIINEHSILAKLMVQTSRIAGLALVFDHIVGFEGNEFYFHRPEQGWGSLSYGQLLFHYPECSVLGLRNERGDILINPPRETLLGETDEAIVLAEDDSAIRFVQQPVDIHPLPIRPASPRPKQIEKQLIVGWSHKAATIIDEYSDYIVDGSVIDVLVNRPSEEILRAFEQVRQAHAAIAMHLIEADLDKPEVVRSLCPERYDNIIILAGEGGVAELLDSDTIAILLEFRQYFRELGIPQLKTQLITEVADSENIEVIKEAGVRDFLISNQFVSKIYAQVSENADVLKVYEDLFKEEGSELYLKPLSLFLEEIPLSVTFADLCAAALERGESCLGVRILSDEADKAQNFGIHINPAKSEVFSLRPEDSLITLAEDES